MDNLKVSTHQFNRGVNSNQRTEKQRDESFIASSLTEDKGKNKANVEKTKEPHANEKSAVAEDRSAALLEQRKQEKAQQLSEKERMSQSLDKSQELNVQRQIEDRSAANRQKLKGTYAAVQQSDKQKQAQESNADKSKESRSDRDDAKDAINLVV